MEEWLAERRGSRVSLRVPQRGDKKALLETVARNAAESLALHKTRRASDLTTRSRALQEIQEALGLDEAPLRIECYDVSNLQGTHVVASMVVFEDGLARKSEYRRFSIKGFAGTDDVAAIHEVITRRFRRYLEEREATGELDSLGDPEVVRPTGDRRPRKFAYPPHWSSSTAGRPRSPPPPRALDELGIDDVAVCGLAKRLEEVWLPGEDAPVILPRTSEGLYLLQRVRDEAHRFAITYHRAKRSKAPHGSALDDVPGLGPARQARCSSTSARCSGSPGATEAEIAEVPGIGPRLASAVLAALRPERRRRSPSGEHGAGRHEEDDGDARSMTRAQSGDAGRRAATQQERRERAGAGERARRARGAPGPDIVIITGMSGAGRSTAAKSLEDLGWFVVDNLPPGLLPTMVDLARAGQGDVPRIAAVVDVRSRAFSTDLQSSHRRAGRPGRQARGWCSWRPATRRWCAGSRTSAARTRCRTTAGWSTASPPSASCCASCGATPTWSSTPPASTSTSCGPG